jgi:alpha,alpha-trehalose phosphorylase (configuration-retaining)
MIALAIHDSVYLLDFCVGHVDRNDEHYTSNSITDFIISKLSEYEHEHLCKILGAGVPQKVIFRSPTLCSRLWAELDVVPISPHDYSVEGLKPRHDQISWDSRNVEEQADSMARKCIMLVTPVKTCSLKSLY